MPRMKCAERVKGYFKTEAKFLLLLGVPFILRHYAHH
jgi:hypothetical protein